MGAGRLQIRHGQLSAPGRCRRDGSRTDESIQVGPDKAMRLSGEPGNAGRRVSGRGEPHALEPSREIRVQDIGEEAPNRAQEGGLASKCGGNGTSPLSPYGGAGGGVVGLY